MIGRVLTAVIGLAAASVLASAAFADTITVGSGPHGHARPLPWVEFPCRRRVVRRRGGNARQFFRAGRRHRIAGDLHDLGGRCIDATDDDALLDPVQRPFPVSCPSRHCPTSILTLASAPRISPCWRPARNALVRAGVIDVNPVEGLATTDPYPAGEFAMRDYNQGGSNGQFNYDLRSRSRLQRNLRRARAGRTEPAGRAVRPSADLAAPDLDRPALARGTRFAHPIWRAKRPGSIVPLGTPPHGGEGRCPRYGDTLRRLAHTKSGERKPPGRVIHPPPLRPRPTLGNAPDLRASPVRASVVSSRQAAIARANCVVSVTPDPSYPTRGDAISERE